MMDQIFNYIYVIVFFLCTLTVQINRIYISKIYNDKTGIIVYSVLSIILISLMIITGITIK